MNSLSAFDVLGRDLRYGFRMLRKTPGFTAIALVTLAVGIGVNTAVFTVVNALLLKPLPYPDPGNLAIVATFFSSPRGQGESNSVDGRTFLAIRDNAKLVSVAAMAGGLGGGVNLVTNGAAANVEQRRVSAGYFGVLGVKPYIGREFTADEDRAGGQPVAVLSYDIWSRVFGSDREIVGRPITLRGEPYTVVGVMPKGFTTGVPTDVWTPLRPSTTGEGGGTNYGMIARVGGGATWAEANAEVGVLGSPAARFGRKEDVAARSYLVPMQQDSTADIRQPLLMLWGAVGLVLLIACVNLAGLLLARSSIRVREIATRMALGSGRRAVVRQLLVESAVLALGGAVLGVAVGWAVLEALKRLSARVFPIGYPVQLDARVLAITLVAALATSVLFGLVPALQASRVDVQATLAESGTRGVARGSARGRRLLVVAEVALGVVLLVGAGLLIRSFLYLSALNPGFDPSNVVTATISLQDARYVDAGRINRLFSDSLERIRRQPGVESAGVTLGLPYTRLLNMGFGRVEGATDEDKGGMTNVSYVTPGYFEALKVFPRTGRLFTDADQSGSMPVAIVNEQFAKRFYKGQDIRGLHLRVAGVREVIGVIPNARATSSGLGGDNGPLPEPAIVYIPATQTPSGFFTGVHIWFSPSWTVRSRGPVEGLPGQIREALTAVDTLLPIAKLQTMTDVQADALAQQRFMMSLVVGLGAVALLLAAIGIHGLISSSVNERTRELGIRLALGATARQTMMTVVTPGVTLAAIGVAIGAGVAVAVSRLLQSFLWGVTSTDSVTFAAVIVLLLLVALVASVIPALRVLRLDPALTLRAE